ncbi:hypothetical protein PVAND_003270 [Polypedilum vanderplanki]|uniref:Uncharacterized protein n=1 Tax=Polypedilum vanderplanki TaxID=319348 RepID=A0A9J6BUL7_POLVA|nr:hypothetical protein PVAND_003270 [Polypedilum vanderplanki]
MDHFDVIKENKDYWEWHLKLRKVNKTRSLVGMVEIKKPIGNDFTAQINILKNKVNSGHLFEAILDRFEIVTENTDIWEWHFKVRKLIKHDQLLAIQKLKIPIGNDYKFEMKVLKKQGNAPFCDFHSDDKMFYPEVGNYTWNGVVFSLENVPRIILPTGEFANEMIFIKPDNEVFAVYRTFAYINNI